MIQTIGRKGYYYKFDDNIQEHYWASSHYKWFREIKQLHLDNEVIAIIKRRWRFPLNIYYEISFDEGITAILMFKRLFWKCTFQGDLYEFIIHKGRKSSIFKNHIQIGYINLEFIETFGNETLYLHVDDDINKPLLYSFIVAAYLQFDYDDSTVSFDFGNIGPEKKKFNEEWQPKHSSGSKLL